MKIIAALLLVASFAAHAERDKIVSGIIQKNGHEIELYDTQGTCKAHWKMMAAYPINHREDYVAGCYFVAGEEIVVQMRDGAEGSFKRSQVIPARAIGKSL